MRASSLFFRTFKEAPQDADSISQQLLERAGFIRKLNKGIYSFAPLMSKVLKKTIQIIREELDHAGAQEVSLPLLHAAELWQKTGRWEDFTSAKLLYTLKDREEHLFCLAPTHEEVIVSLVANWATSYKQLPFNLYQIGTKFRDEIRPRFGLIRCKEFFMKDGYSFCKDAAEMEMQYQKMRVAYSNIFRRLGLEFVIVEAHGGKIGKGKSEEFQVKAEIGDDLLMICGDYAANIEATQSIPPSFNYSSELKNKEKIATPSISSITDLATFLKIPPQLILKTVLYKLIFADREEFVAIGMRGDRQVNETKVATFFGSLEIALASDDEIKQVTGCRPGFAGPLSAKYRFVADFTCKPMTNFVCAGNEEDVHYINVNWQRDLPYPDFQDFLLAETGDLCPSNPNERFTMQRGIEVGHIFNLGTRYTEALNAFYQDEKGNSLPIWMGTYGIGVGRAIAACIEQRHDAKGIIWPLAIAPFKILVTSAFQNDDVTCKIAESCYNLLLNNGFEPLLDDREERLGFKLKDSDLIGLPFKLIIGKAYLQDKKIEIESRLGEKFLIPEGDLISWAHENLK